MLFYMFEPPNTVMKAQVRSKSETPRDLRKKNERLKMSRDALKDKSREKAKEIKRLSGKIDDLDDSRDKWRTRYESEVGRTAKLEERNHALEESLNAEQQLTHQLRLELDSLKKKALT